MTAVRAKPLYFDFLHFFKDPQFASVPARTRRAPSRDAHPRARRRCHVERRVAGRIARRSSGPIVTFLHLSLSTSTSTLSRRCRARPRPNIVAELAWSSPCVFVAATRRRTTCEKRGLRAERRRRWCAKRLDTLAGRGAWRRRRTLAGEQPQSPLGAAARCGQPPRVLGNSMGPRRFTLAARRCLVAARRAVAEAQTI